MILPCQCSGHNSVKQAATYQDATYGVGQRVHTPTMKEDIFRCTVCLAEHKKPGKTLSKKEMKALKEEEKAKAKEKEKKELRRR